MPRDIPIIFSAPMVLALLAGRKTQTRRLAWRTVKDPADDKLTIRGLPSPWLHVHRGDRLWVREAWKPHSTFHGYKPRDIPQSRIFFAADNTYAPSNTPWRPSIFMPRWASRLTLTVTATKVERLQDITEADALAEGMPDYRMLQPACDEYMAEAQSRLQWPQREFALLWKKLHGPGAWDANPEVLALTFTVEQKNIDAR